jgi:hypothetical protein
MTEPTAEEIAAWEQATRSLEGDYVPPAQIIHASNGVGYCSGCDGPWPCDEVWRTTTRHPREA